MKRRGFLHVSQTAAVGALFNGSKVSAAQTFQRADIRNVLFLFVDQQRQDCLGCYGNNTVRTPNLDRLSRNGIRFNNAYTPSPVCTPARTSLQTGLWAHNHRLIFNTGYDKLRGGLNNPEPETRFFSEMLSEQGWQCGHVGKWHIGTSEHRPDAHGYDPAPPYYPDYGVPSNIYGYRNGSKPHEHYRAYLESLGLDGFRLLEQTRQDRPLYAGLQEGPPEASIPHYLASMTTETLRRYSGSEQPFFLSCNFWGPHAPYAIPEPYYGMYGNAGISAWPNFDCRLDDKPEVLRQYARLQQTDWFTRDNLPDLIGKYYGYITLIDEAIGQILDTLEQSGEREHTLIVYTADHGSTVGSYRMWDKGYGMYDCITRIPLIVSHPALKPAVSDAYVTLLDLAPTFLDIAGVTVPDAMDGTSLMPILEGKTDRIRDDHIVTEHHGHHFPFWQRMVRSDDYKYIFNYTAGPELYDLRQDPYETKNIIDIVDSTTRERYEDMLLTWMNEVKDPVRNYAKLMLAVN